MSLHHHRVQAVIDELRIPITHRSQVAELMRARQWNGAAEIVSGDGTVETVMLDPRLVTGRLPSNVAWWRTRQLMDGASLDEVGGPKQLAEALFGVAHKRLGQAAYRAFSQGRGNQVGVLAAGHAQVEPDVLARMLDTGTTPLATWWSACDPHTDAAALQFLLDGVDPSAHAVILGELLGALPAGVTPALAQQWADDDALAGVLVAQAPWDVIDALVTRRVELGLDCSQYAGTLRHRGAVGAAVIGELSVLHVARLVGDDELLARCVAGAGHALIRTVDEHRKAIGDAGGALDGAFTGDITSAFELLENIVRDSDGHSRALVNKIGVLAEYDPAMGIALLERVAEARGGLQDAIDEHMAAFTAHRPDQAAELRRAFTHGTENLWWTADGQLSVYAAHDPDRTHALLARFPDASAGVLGAGRTRRENEADLELGRLAQLTQAAQASSAHIRQDVAARLGATPARYAEQAFTLVEQLAADEYPGVRQAALAQLGALAAHDAERAFALAEQCRDTGDITTAMYAAGQFGVLGAYDADRAYLSLERLASSDDTYEARTAARQLGTFAAHDTERAFVLAEQLGARHDGVAPSVIAELGVLAAHDTERAFALAEAVDRTDTAAVTALGGQIGVLAEHDPVRAVRLYDTLDEFDVDIEQRLALARLVPGTVSNPMFDALRSAQQTIVSGDPEAIEQWRKSTSLAELVGLSWWFPVDEQVRAHFAGETLTLDGTEYSVRTITSRGQLERNATQMGNCTRGRADQLSSGKILLAIDDADGNTVYNAQLMPRKGRWVLEELDSRRNAGGPELPVLGRMLDERLARLDNDAAGQRRVDPAVEPTGS